MSQAFQFVLACLAVWRISEMFVLDVGPFAIFERLRTWTGKGQMHKLITCMYCLSMHWAFAVVALLVGIGTVALEAAPLWWLAIGGGSVLIHRLVPAREPR